MIKKSFRIVGYRRIVGTRVGSSSLSLIWNLGIRIVAKFFVGSLPSFDQDKKKKKKG